MDGKKYLYRGREMAVHQSLSDCKFGVITKAPDAPRISACYRWVKSFGKYASREEAQAVLDEFAADRGLETCADA